MVLPDNFSYVEHTLDVIRQGHNRALNTFFLDVKNDTVLYNNRSHIKLGLRIRNEDSAIEVSNKQLYFQTLREQHQKQAIASVPEWWATRVGADRPQLVVVFRAQGKTSWYQMTIPHYQGDRHPKFPAYRKGSYRGEITLTDNSKLVCNANSEGEADRILRIMMRHVNPKYLKNREPKYVKQRRALSEVKVIPLFADFYSHGQTNAQPDWRSYFG